MLTQIIRSLFPAKPNLNAEWEKAKAAYEDAVRRGDTRAQHERWATLFAATNACLKAQER
jgi:hypothetical protein